MKKTSLIAIAMTATLALGACATEDEPENNTTAEENGANNGAEENTADNGAEENGANDGAEATDDAGDETEGTDDAAGGTDDAAGETGDAAGADYSDPSCQEFFTEGGPLADRAETIRTALDNGEINDQVTYSELSLLKQRIDSTIESADGDIATLLEEVNAPFAEVSDLVNEGDALDAESGELTLPEEIDTQASADAQTELEAACAG